VIDVRAGLLSSTLQALSDIGFIELGKTGLRPMQRPASSVTGIRVV
jgi:hypothetical protein